MKNIFSFFPFKTAILGQNDNAVWFSKNIIPAIRDEEKYREEDRSSKNKGHKNED